MYMLARLAIVQTTQAITAHDDHRFLQDEDSGEACARMSSLEVIFSGSLRGRS